MWLRVCILALKKEQHTEVGLSIKIVGIRSENRGKLLCRQLRLLLRQKLMGPLLMSGDLLRGSATTRLRNSCASHPETKQEKK